MGKAMKRLSICSALVFFGLSCAVHAQAPQMKCSYMNMNTNQTVSGKCTSGSAGVAITDPAGALVRISLSIKDHQGEWTVVEINGTSGMRYELDRCNFTYATSDLKQFLETHLSCESKATTQKDDRSIFMTAGGAWVGRWYTGNPRICKKPGGAVEGLPWVRTRPAASPPRCPRPTTKAATAALTSSSHARRELLVFATLRPEPPASTSVIGAKADQARVIGGYRV
jgi:hypothetical protein